MATADDKAGMNIFLSLAAL